MVTYFCLPETRGRSAAELDEMFEAKVPARRFKSEILSPRDLTWLTSVANRLQVHGFTDSDRY